MQILKGRIMINGYAVHVRRKSAESGKTYYYPALRFLREPNGKHGHRLYGVAVSRGPQASTKYSVIWGTYRAYGPKRWYGPNWRRGQALCLVWGQRAAYVALCAAKPETVGGGRVVPA